MMIMENRPSVFVIELDNPSAAFYVGQTVSGRVKFYDFNQDVRGLSLKAKGKSAVSWSVKETVVGINDDTTCLLNYAAEEVYLDVELVLNEGCGVDRGTYVEMPFNVVLGRNLPSSFYSNHGTVRYKLKAEALLTMGHGSLKCYQPLTIHSVSDLNLQPTNLRPKEVIKHKELWNCLCCVSGTINVRAWIDKRGYVPGEMLHMGIDVENLSSRELKAKVQLLRQETFKARQPKHGREINTTCLHEQNLSENLESWQNVVIPIPETVPSGLPYCNTIDVDYKIKLFIEIGVWDWDIEMFLDIIIGNIPFHCSDETRVPVVTSEPTT